MSDLSDFLLVTRREPVTLPGAPGPLYIRELLAEALLALTSGPDSTFAALAACLTVRTHAADASPAAAKRA